jgi:hypothetical protein
MIIIGSAILFLFGMLLLLISAVRIAFGLIKLCFYLLALAVLLPVTALLGLCVFVQWCVKLVRGQAADEHCITITIDDDAPIIDLPRESYRRLS